MNNIHKGVILGGVIISILLAGYSILLTLAGIIITATIFMLFLISESAGKAMDKPILQALLGEDGRSFIISNIGNRDAYEIRISVIPSNLEFFIQNLPADAKEKTDCGQLLGKNKIIMDYTDDKGTGYSKTSVMDLKEDSEYDPTKPLIPIFQ